MGCCSWWWWPTTSGDVCGALAGAAHLSVGQVSVFRDDLDVVGVYCCGGVHDSSGMTGEP